MTHIYVLQKDLMNKRKKCLVVVWAKGRQNLLAQYIQIQKSHQTIPSHMWIRTFKPISKRSLQNMNESCVHYIEFIVMINACLVDSDTCNDTFLNWIQEEKYWVCKLSVISVVWTLTITIIVFPYWLFKSANVV